MFLVNLYIHVSWKNIQFYPIFYHISLIFHSEISLFDQKSCICDIFEYFWLVISRFMFSFSCRLKWATTTTCLGLLKAVLVLFSNKSHLRFHAWYYQYMSIYIKNRYFCMYFSINIYDRIIHTQHILNMFRHVLRIFSCNFYVFMVIFITKMSDIITPYRKTRNFRLFDHWSYVWFFFSLHISLCFYT